MNLKIACDLDGTVLDFHRHLRDLYKVWYDTEIDPADCVGWDWPIELTHFENYQQLFAWFDMADGWLTMPWIPGAPGGLDMIAADNSIEFVTSRVGPEAVRQTSMWKGTTPFKNRTTHHERYKPQVKCGLFIDDSPEVIRDVVKVGRDVIVFDQPWNRKLGVVLERKVLRAENWSDVVNFVGMLSNMPFQDVIKEIK